MEIFGSCFELSSETSPIRLPEDAWLQQWAVKIMVKSAVLMRRLRVVRASRPHPGAPNNAVPKGLRRAASGMPGVARPSLLWVRRGPPFQANASLHLLPGDSCWADRNGNAAGTRDGRSNNRLRSK